MAAGVDRRGERDGADDMGGHEEHGGNDGHEEHDLEDTNRLADRRSYAESVQGEDAVVEDLRQRTDMAEHSWYGSYK
jgi:hypothetical protein